MFVALKREISSFFLPPFLHGFYGFSIVAARALPVVVTAAVLIVVAVPLGWREKWLQKESCNRKWFDLSVNSYRKLRCLYLASKQARTQYREFIQWRREEECVNCGNWEKKEEMPRNFKRTFRFPIHGYSHYYTDNRNGFLSTTASMHATIHLSNFPPISFGKRERNRSSYHADKYIPSPPLLLLFERR